MSASTSSSMQGSTEIPPGRLLDVIEAASEIRQACEDLDGDAHRSPFFFVVGAGISFPPVPLATQIIEHCESVAKRYGRGNVPERGETLDRYSHWFARAYPAARQRQAYLRSLIEKRSISLPSLRLAHLLSAHKLTNLVVTTNFDDFVARALRLFGEEPAVCDHPQTVGRIDRERPDIQLVHVHGSYLFYDCANLRGEVTGRARPDEETSFTMVGLLDSILWTCSPLVIGYSGWEGDIIMSALKRRLRGGHPLAHSLYWFCYRRADLQSLPNWLRANPDVRFVVPPDADGARSAVKRTVGKTRARPTASEMPTEPTLPSYQVFDQLNRAFDIGTPALFENPIRYFASSLEASLPQGDGVVQDPYGFKPLIAQLRHASDQFGRIPASSANDAELEGLRELMRRSQYREAVKRLAAIIPVRLAGLDETARREVIDAAALAGGAVLSKLGKKKPDAELANALVFDAPRTGIAGRLSPRMTWCFPSRSGQMAVETTIGGKPHGRFTYHLVQTLRDPGSDVDRDGRITVLEAMIGAARTMMGRAEWERQIPVVFGAPERVALFASRKRPPVAPEHATIHALLVGVGKHRQPGMDLAGPANDVAAMAEMLEARDRKLFERAVITRLVNRDATSERVTRALGDLVKMATPRDVIVFYFSGHTSEFPSELPDAQESALVLHDIGSDHGYIPHSVLAASLAAAQAAHTIVVMD